MSDVKVTPDGARYLVGAQGFPLPYPFHLRWLAPKLLGDTVGRWQWSSRISLAVYSLLVVAFVGWTWQGLAAGALVAGLPSTRYHWIRPVLVDAPAQALALGAAVCWLHGWWPAAIVLVLVAGMVKESAPIFAACFAWHPLLLIGLLAPGLKRLLGGAGPDVLDEMNAEILAHPIKASMAAHDRRWRDPYLMLLPWGGCLAAVAFPSWQLLVALALGYGMLVVATDSVRLYQWAAPMVAASAVLVPVVWLPVLVIATWMNPWPNDGS